MPNPPPLAEIKSHTRVGPWSLMGCDQGRAIWKQQLGTGHCCTVCRNGSGGSRSRWQGLGRREVSPGGVCHPKSRDGTALPPAGLLERMAPPDGLSSPPVTVNPSEPALPAQSTPSQALSPVPERVRGAVAYSRAFTSASLASMRIWISARAASSAAPDSSACAFSKFALAACSGEGLDDSQVASPAWYLPLHPQSHELLDPAACSVPRFPLRHSPPGPACPASQPLQPVTALTSRRSL